MGDALQEDARIGSVIAGRYRVTDLLGAGGMGAVYRADDLGGGRSVALKILRRRLGRSREAIARFQREADVGAKIVHPNCVGITDAGRCEDGAIYLTMELVDGASLAAVIDRERRIPWRRALHIARNVLCGLGHAHDQGVVHRDVKSDNIFLCRRDGDPDFARILDFGIAKLVGAASGPEITQAGLTVGTPEYLSPEQATGDAIDRRSDLYSMSVVLFEMLTGTTPFANVELAKILNGHVSDPVPSFTAVAPDLVVPPDVEALVRDGLAKLPGDRIPSAAAYVARIDALCATSGGHDTVPDGEVGIILDGRYRLERLIGRGGMGRVYRASHLGLGRPVATKILDSELVDDDDARRRFEREAQATGKLRHPNCVAVTDFGATPDGKRYLVMDLIEGITLGDLLDQHPRLPAPRAVHIMRHILHGLAHAHGHGLVHRDLKPTNIMLVTEGGDPDFARILDFGLARIVGGDDRITRTGIVCGTPRYMSPEQILGRPFDARADLYAASVILFEMLAGRTPFDGEESQDLLKMHLSAPVPRIADVAPGAVVPAALEDVIRRGLAKRAADRPTSADHYLAELDRACATAPTIELSHVDLESVMGPAAPAPPRAAPRGRNGSRRRIAIGAGIGAVLLVGIIAAIAGDAGRGSAAREAVAQPEAAPSAPATESTPSLDPEVAEALQLAQSGGGREAVAHLRELQRRRPDDPQIPFVLGRLYARLNWPKPEIDAYRDAIRLDPSLRENPELIHDLIELLESRRAWQLAAQMLEQEVGAPAVPALTEAAEHHPSGAIRARAAAIRHRL